MSRLHILGAICVVALLALIVTPMFGTRTILPMSILATGGNNPEADIFWQIRAPRTVLAFLAGAGLAMSGLAFQSIFRNPLAAPFTLGVSSGASFGAALYVRVGLPLTVLGIPGASFSAFFGAILSIFVVYGISRARKGLSTATMLLAGVAVHFCFISLILFMQYTGDFTQTFSIVRWLMGGLEVVGFQTVLSVLPFVLVGSVVLLGLSNELNLMITGEDLAASRGVDVERVKLIVFFITSLMIGGVVAVAGPIGFVGMMAPHICRLLIGAEHRLLAPATLVFGGAFLAVCDTIARTVISPTEIPVGIITAMLGGPFFIWLLSSRFGERFFQERR